MTQKREDEDRVKETLICKVEQQPALYDKSNPQYKDAKFKASLFGAIASDLGCTALEAQTWWRILRDAYTAEKRLRECEMVSGNRAEKRKPFRFYGAMSFLMPYVRKRRSLSTLPADGDNDDKAGELLEAEIVFDGDVSELPVVHSLDAHDTPRDVDELAPLPGTSETKITSSNPNLCASTETSGVFASRSRAKKEALLNESLTKALSSLDKAVSNPNDSQKSAETLLGESIGTALNTMKNKDIKNTYKRKFRDLLSDMEDEALCGEE